jgi:anti-anti-sigma factor
MMDVTTSQYHSRVPVTVLHVKGDINMTMSDVLLAQIHQAFDNGTRDLVLDLTEVPTISSAGLRIFLDTLNLMRADARFKGLEAPRPGSSAFKSPHFKLCNPSEQVRRVMALTGLDVFLDIYDDLDIAVASF